MRTPASKELILAIRTAVAAGKLVRDLRQELTAVKQKGVSPRDVVSQVDIVAEDLARQILQKEFPADAILGEERGPSGSGQRTWLLDPIDGTVNYVFGLPVAATSVALLEGERVLAGAVYNPFTNDLYYAATGFGAFVNAQRLEVRSSSFEEGLYAAAFSNRADSSERRAREFRLFQSVNDATRGCLRTGSAAMNLCYVAAGKLSGAWGVQGKAWDIAAGLIIAQEAGARVEVFGSVLGPESKVDYYVASDKNSPELGRRLRAVLGK